MKKLLSVLLITFLLTSSFMAGAMAQPPVIKVTVNGKQVIFPTNPVIIDNTTMVPMREIFDALGASVNWDGATKSVTGEREGVKVQLTLNKKNATRNGSPLQLKVAAQLVNGKTMVPTKFIAEALGATVTWDGPSKTVIITDNYKEIESSPIDIKIHYIDVGQGDAIFIDAGDYDILIDAGDNSSGQVVVDYLKELNTDDIEILVATHPHADHIGGLDDVMNAFEVEQIIDSGMTYTSNTYTDYMNAVTIETAQGALFKYDEDQTFNIADNVTFEIIEALDDHDNANENSVISKLVAGDTSFLFMGDAEFATEAMLTKEEAKCDVLKVGHHGSNSSSSLSFLLKTEADYGIISCGEDNKYGHPHQETLNALKKANMQTHRTDKNRTLVLGTDGKEISFLTDVIDDIGKEVTITDNKGIQIIGIDKSAEIVAIKNTGDQAVSLKGWTLVSEKGNQIYDFPTIELKSKNTIYITAGPDAKEDGVTFYKWTTAYIWNNSGHDPGFLKDSNGTVVSSWTN